MMKIYFVIGIVFTVLTGLAHGGDSDNYVLPFSIRVLNLAISQCDPTTCINTCACDVNDVEWTPCVDKSCNMTSSRPNIGSCLSMWDIGDMCALFSDPNEVRTCPPGWD